MNVNRVVSIAVILAAIAVCIYAFFPGLRPGGQGAEVWRASTSASGAASVAQGEKNWEIRDFSNLSYSSSLRLTIEQGDEESLTLNSADCDARDFNVFVSGGTLHVEDRADGFWRPKSGEFTLRVKRLENLTGNGSGEISVGDLQSDALEVRLNGSGNLDFSRLTAQSFRAQVNGSGTLEVRDCAAQSVDVEGNGSGDITLSGSVAASEVRVRLHGSGSFDGMSLPTVAADVSVSGSGSIQVAPSGTLKARTTGSGDIRYSGDPSVDANATGSGRIKRD